MLLTKRSPYTGINNTMEINITHEEYLAWINDPRRALIQEKWPALTPDEREFILSGYTPSDWEMMFGDDEKGGD